MLVRHLDADAPEILLVRPKPDSGKSNYDPATPVPFVLPRGSRQYRRIGAAVDSISPADWSDARSDAEAARHAARLEPLHRALVREAEEEAGLSEATLRKSRLYDLGIMLYRRRNESLDVHWFGCIADAALMTEMNPRPVDVSETRWVDVRTMKGMAQGSPPEARPGYIPIIEEAIERMRGASPPPVFALPPAGSR